MKIVELVIRRKSLLKIFDQMILTGSNTESNGGLVSRSIYSFDSLLLGFLFIIIYCILLLFVLTVLLFHLYVGSGIIIHN